MEQIAFTMQLLPGHADEYKRRHDAIWPELGTLLRDAGAVATTTAAHVPPGLSLAFALWCEAARAVPMQG